MAFSRAILLPFLASGALLVWVSVTRGQTSPSPVPAAPHVELRAKPPDEPSDSQAAPEPAPSESESDEGDDDAAPIDANKVAHPPEIETYVVPDYPAKARAQKIQGRVLLIVIVDESGKVEDNVQIVDSIPMLDQAAVDAVHKWTFTPAHDAEGKPVRVQLQVGVPFVLN